MADKSDDDENFKIGNRHLEVLDSVSEQSESSVISKMSTIKINERDQIRLDEMIGCSDDDSQYSNPSTNQANFVVKNMMNDVKKTDMLLNKNTKNYETQHTENQEVKLLSSVKRNTLTTSFLDGLPLLPNPDSSVDGLSSFLNLTGLSENIPINLSDNQQHLFQNSVAQDSDQHMATDFSPSDGSDFDPTGFNSDDTEKATEDEYYDDPMVNEIPNRLKRNRKRKCEQFQRDEERKSGEKNEKLQIEKVESPKRSKKFEDSDNKENAAKMTGKRTWNRRNACFYCQEIVTNFSRHLLRHHAKEIEVIRYQSINDKDPKIRKLKRQAITDKLRNKGNFIHNSKVSFDRDGASTLLPSKRNNQVTSSPSSYATCNACLGTFKRTTFFRHFKKCDARNNGKNENELPSVRKRVLYNHSITIIPNAANGAIELRDNILSHLRSDEISLVVKNDPLIIAYGSRLLKKKKERRSRKAICSKMRDLATLLTILRKKDTSIENLSDALDPEKYETFIESIKVMCGFDEKTGNVNVTSIPARMRPAILGCVDILYTQSIMSTESTAFKEAYKNKLDDFKRLIEINWQWEISSNAEKTRKRINMTKESVIPLEEDIATVMRKIHKLEIKYGVKLRKDRDILNYESLCIVTIAHIIILDRKRSGDVAEAELIFYMNRKNEEVPEKVLETLTSEQKKNIDDLDVFQIPGKRTRAVPILLTKTMRENIDLIIACREDLKIPNSNKYLFARPGTEEPFDGGKCLEKIKKQCNLKRPEMLTSTGIRHHIATISQIHAKQNDQYTEHLAGFLGHDVAVHSKNYRLPMQVLQKAVVGTQLMEYEKICYTQKTQNKIETISSHSDFFQNKQDKSFSETGKSLDETDQPISLTQNPDRIDKTPETSSLSSDLFYTQKNPETENEEPRNTNEKKDAIITYENKCPENTNENKIMNAQSQNYNQNRNKIQRKRKNSYQVKVPSSSDSDGEKPLQKRNKIIHRKWSEEEIKSVKKHFQSHINKKNNPGKSVCMDVLKKEPVLQNRTWMQLNTYVNNIYKKKK